MRQFISKNKKWIGYTLYCILLAAFFLYFLFPADSLKDHIQSTAQKIYPGIQITTGRLSPSFPAGLKLFKTAISLRENPGQIFFRADKVSLKPSIWSLLKKSPVYYFSCTAYNGNVKGSTIINKDDSATSFSSSIEFQDIRIDKNSPVPSIISDRLAGTLNGSIAYEGGNSISLSQGSGDATLTISEGLVRLAQPVLALEAIDFDEISVRISLKKEKLSISNAELKGKYVIGTLSGTIYLDKDLPGSRLDLKGEIEPTAAMLQDVPGAAVAVNLIQKSFKDGKLPVSLNGTIRDPKINFI
jgi:type II secretion system protein N